ncbi:MAG TPA: hypothetical protein VID71_01235 [Steroidobacteraceae bacterium]
MTNELTGRRPRGGRQPGWRALGTVLALSLAPAWPVLAWHLPWHRRPHHAPAAPSAPALAITLEGQAASAAALPQRWQRNTLLLDLTHLPDNGSATLTPPANAGWPVRLAFRVQPGSIGSLTIEGAERVQYTLPAHGPAMTLQLDPGVYVVKTASLTLRWSAADDLPH